MLAASSMQIISGLFDYLGREFIAEKIISPNCYSFMDFDQLDLL